MVTDGINATETSWQSQLCSQQHPVPTIDPFCFLDINCHLAKLDNLQVQIQQLYDTTKWLIDVIINVIEYTTLKPNPAIIKPGPDPIATQL